MIFKGLYKLTIFWKIFPHGWKFCVQKKIYDQHFSNFSSFFFPKFIININLKNSKFLVPVMKHFKRAFIISPELNSTTNTFLSFPIILTKSSKNSPHEKCNKTSKHIVHSWNNYFNLQSDTSQRSSKVFDGQRALWSIENELFDVFLNSQDYKKKWRKFPQINDAEEYGKKRKNKAS